MVVLKLFRSPWEQKMSFGYLGKDFDFNSDLNEKLLQVLGRGVI